MRKIDWTQMYWLIILSVSASITALIVDESVLAINNFKKQVKSFIFIVLLSMLLAGLACYIMKYVSAQATGSGIPQMKAIMAGLSLPNMLSFRTYLAKCSGMICMLGTGLSLGKEGPFVHISGCIAESLPYRQLGSNKTLRHQFLTAAVAVGVSCTFGAPIGGVLFAVEVSTLHFSVSNLWKAFFCSTISVLCFKLFGSLGTTATFTADASYFYNGNKTIGINHEQPFFVILGLLLGCLGTFYIQFQKRVNQWKKRMVTKYKRTFGNNFIYTLTITFLLTTMIYYTRVMTNPDKAVIGNMINFDKIMEAKKLTNENIDEELSKKFAFSEEVLNSPQTWIMYEGCMVLFIVQKIIATAFTLSCPIPGGIFTPTFTIGAVFGQLYVASLRRVLLFFGISNMIQYRGVYSILGAAAMTASVTRTISVAMIVLELNGHLSHAVPCMVCVLSSYFMSELLKPQSFFEMLSFTTGLDLKIKQKADIQVKDLLEVDKKFADLQGKYLSLEDCTEYDLVFIVKKHGHSTSLGQDHQIDDIHKLRYIPVVDNKVNRNLLFMIKTEELQMYCEEYFGVFGQTAEDLQNKVRSGIELRIVKAGSQMVSSPIKLQYLNQSLLVDNRIGITGPVMDQNLDKRPGKWIILALRHLAPPTVYDIAPLTYMTEGQANKFYEGEGENLNDQTEDPSVMVYCAVQSIYEIEVPKEEQLATSINAEDYDPEPLRTVHGMKLVGLIPVSDAFGVDLLVENYQGILKEQAQDQEMRLQNLKKTPEELGVELNYGEDFINYSPRFKDDPNDEKPQPGIKPKWQKETEADLADKRAQDQREIELNEQEEMIAKKEKEMQALVMQMAIKESALKGIVDRLSKKSQSQRSEN